MIALRWFVCLMLAVILVVTAGGSDFAVAGVPSSRVDGGGDPVRITADSLEYREAERVYVARGGAKVERGDLVIAAEVLTAHFERKAGGDPEVVRVVAEAAPKGVVVVTSGAHGENRLSGDHGEYDVRRAVAVMRGGDLRLTTPQDVLTATQSVTYFERERKAVAEGDAVVVHHQESGVMQKVSADVLSAVLAPAANGQLEVQHVFAQGNVLIVTPNEVVRGEEGDYDVRAQKAVLDGAVKITRGKNQLEGKRAEVDLVRGVSRLLSGGSGDRVKGLIIPEDAQEAK